MAGVPFSVPASAGSDVTPNSTTPTVRSSRKIVRLSTVRETLANGDTSIHFDPQSYSLLLSTKIFQGEFEAVIGELNDILCGRISGDTVHRLGYCCPCCWPSSNPYFLQTTNAEVLNRLAGRVSAVAQVCGDDALWSLWAVESGSVTEQLDSIWIEVQVTLDGINDYKIAVDELSNAFSSALSLDYNRPLGAHVVVFDGPLRASSSSASTTASASSTASSSFVASASSPLLTTKKCIECDHVVPKSAKFCLACGHPV